MKTSDSAMGALTVRFPKSLHQRVKALAEQEGVSINQFVVLATAEKAALLDARVQLDYLAARARRGEALAARAGKTPGELLREMLDQAPDVEPTPEDRLPEGV